MTPTPAGKALLNAFERIVIINLPHRKDRRREIKRELQTLGLSVDKSRVQFFEALRPTEAAGFPTVGAHGAFLSHRAVCAMMLAQGWERMLILEDDLRLLPDALPRLAALAEGLGKRPWDVVYGHPGLGADAATPPDAAGLIALAPTTEMIQLHFLGLSRPAALHIVPELGAMLNRPPGSPEGGPMHVDGALNWVRNAHPELVTLAASPAIAAQRPSRSDIADPRWFDRMPGIAALAGLARRLRH